ncbi:acyl transferase/acyl hydrolase/lysophospholipase [Xylaria sp. FL1042]|nr:acyl transferase/acyl hydrolase/lysophospholipase [Xylaria sp. FL1042]
MCYDRTMEDIVEKLLAWANVNHSKSVNLPSKPHAIIALNKCPNSTPDEMWNSLTATDQLFKSMSSQIQKNNTFQGGGVRGIVELSVLRALESRIGVPLHNFFDLVVGTSTGGIISIGFGHALWSVEECIDHFKALVGNIFTPRKGQVHGFRHLQLLIQRSKYETKPIENPLQDALGDESLFGNRLKNGSHRLKVAVTTVTDAGTQALVLSNYNATDSSTSDTSSEKSKPKYRRYRPTRPEDELTAWEAARATSAAPGFFMPFRKACSAHVDCEVFPEMMDGAILHNNPIYVAIEEARRISDIQDQRPFPDLVLSVGTGLPKYSRVEEDVPNLTSEKNATIPQRAVIRRKPGLVRTIFTMINYQIQLNMDSERRWAAWSEPYLRDPYWKDRLYRLNPDLGEEPPAMDDMNKVNSLSNNVAGWIENHVEIQEKINEIACSLVASSFYFELDGKPVQAQDSSVRLCGFIRCRIPEEVQERGGLGAFFASCHSAVAFVVQNSANGTEADLRVEILIADRRERGVYNDLSVTFTIPNEIVETTIVLDLRGISRHRHMFNISGFPRQLMQDGYRRERQGHEIERDGNKQDRYNLIELQ